MSEIHDLDEIPISEYTAKYCWKVSETTRVQPQADPYETLVEAKIKGNSPKKAKTEVKKAVDEDPYELLVQKKIKEASEKKEEEKSQKSFDKTEEVYEEQPSTESRSSSRIQIEEDPYEKLVQKCIKSSKAPEQLNQEPKSAKIEPVQPIQPPTPEKEDNESVSSISKKQSSKTNKVPKRTFLGTNRPVEEPPVKNNANYSSKPKSSKSARFLSASTNNIHPKVTVYRPNFYADPNDAPEEEKPNLHGPFWVYWPKDAVIPNKYAGLRKVLKRK